MRSFVKSRLAKLGVATLCALVSVSAVHAQGVPPEQKALDARQSVFKLLDWSFAPTTDMLRNRAKWDAAAVQKSAARIEVLAPMIPDAFVLDTRKASGLKTKAREGIWSNQADFKSKADDLAKAATNLAAVAKSGGDDKALRQAAMAVGKACSACHDSYKDK